MTTDLAPEGANAQGRETSNGFRRAVSYVEVKTARSKPSRRLSWYETSSGTPVFDNKQCLNTRCLRTSSAARRYIRYSSIHTAGPCSALLRYKPDNPKPQPRPHATRYTPRATTQPDCSSISALIGPPPPVRRPIPTHNARDQRLSLPILSCTSQPSRTARLSPTPLSPSTRRVCLRPCGSALSDRSRRLLTCTTTTTHDLLAVHSDRPHPPLRLGNRPVFSCRAKPGTWGEMSIRDSDRFRRHEDFLLAHPPASRRRSPSIYPTPAHIRRESSPPPPRTQDCVLHRPTPAHPLLTSSLPNTCERRYPERPTQTSTLRTSTATGRLLPPVAERDGNLRCSGCLPAPSVLDLDGVPGELHPRQLDGLDMISGSSWAGTIPISYGRGITGVTLIRAVLKVVSRSTSCVPTPRCSRSSLAINSSATRWADHRLYGGAAVDVFAGWGGWIGVNFGLQRNEEREDDSRPFSRLFVFETHCFSCWIGLNLNLTGERTRNKDERKRTPGEVNNVVDLSFMGVQITNPIRVPIILGYSECGCDMRPATLTDFPFIAEFHTHGKMDFLGGVMGMRETSCGHGFYLLQGTTFPPHIHPYLTVSMGGIKLNYAKVAEYPVSDNNQLNGKKPTN
ncbi:hypothetical protein DFH09DRAFT_1508867 [Mycena vulgaris]|nr:hypothetical protein DFH09DRAFT_1508867 [Mycena vulgaris]